MTHYDFKAELLDILQEQQAWLQEVKDQEEQMK
jgi:hypothetical protein